MGLEAPRPRLVGRADDLAELRSELRRAAAGELRCVLLLGEAGVGKTRLAEELLQHGRAAALGLRARAYPLGGTSAFDLWVQALEGYLRTLDPERLEELCGDFADDLAATLRSIAAARGGAPDREPPRRRLLESLAVLVDRLARERPLVILLDDVHLADASSWELLHYLAVGLPGCPALVVATARGGELASARVANEVVSRLEQEGQLRRVAVEPLGVEAVGQLASAALAKASVPPALTRWLAERSRGNPLFALGLLQALLDEGADLHAPDLTAIPDSLAERVRSRLARLSEPELATLELLAVLGRPIELGALVHLAGRPLERLDDILELLVRTRLVVESERGRETVYEINHPLVQETIYTGIGAARRRALHRRAARALHDAGRLGEAAPHFATSAERGDPEAIAALVDAVRQADRREAHREEIAILEALLELIPEGDERWLEVLDAMARDANWVVEHRADLGTDTLIRAMREIERVLARSEDLTARATTKLRLASFLSWGQGELDAGEQAAREALELFREAGDDAGIRLAENELAWVHGLRGDFRDQLEAGVGLLERAEAAGDRFALLEAAGLVGLTASQLGEWDWMRRGFELSERIAREEGKRYRLTWTRSLWAVALRFERSLDEALGTLADAAAEDPQHADTVLLQLRAVLAAFAGRYADALDDLQALLAWNGGTLSRRQSMAYNAGAVAAAELGRLRYARELADKAGELVSPERPFLSATAYSPWAAGVVATAAGDPGEGIERIEVAVRWSWERGALATAVSVLPDMCDAALAAEDAGAADRAAARLDEAARRIDRDPVRGHADAGRAVAALLGGDAAQSAEAAARAEKLLGAYGWRGHQGRALDVLGRALAAGGDRPGAVAAFERAASVFDACGAEPRRQRVLAKLGELGGAGRRAVAAAAGPESLTEREREVAELAAEGLTAREIGERLFIGKRTVETHLARAYAKLGVGSKLELARRWPELLP